MVKFCCARCGRVLYPVAPSTVLSDDVTNRPVAVTNAGEAGTGPFAAGLISRKRFTCHRRCGAAYVKHLDKIQDAMAVAEQEGRGRIVLGVDL